MDVHPIRIDNNRFWPIPTSKFMPISDDLWIWKKIMTWIDMEWFVAGRWWMMRQLNSSLCLKKKWGNMKLRWFIIILSSANLDFWDNRIFAVPSCCKPRVADEACQRDFSPPGGSLHRRRHVDRESTNPESHINVFIHIYIYIYI